MIIIRKGRDKAIKRARSGQPIENTESDLTILEPIGHPDAFSWVRPEHMEPTQSKTSKEVRKVMRTQKDECLAILQDMSKGEGSLHKIRMSVKELGKIDMYQWLYFLALHAKRHIAQIESVWDEWENQAT